MLVARLLQAADDATQAFRFFQLFQVHLIGVDDAACGPLISFR